MEVFVGSKLLSQEARSDDGSVCIADEAAVGLVMEQGLAEAKNDQRIESAANDSQRERDHDGTANFGEDHFHMLIRV